MIQPFQFSNGQLAHNADDLLELCQQFPLDGVNYLVREDLEKWLTYIGKDDIAQYAASARQAAVEDRQKLEEFLNKCHTLASPETPSSVSAIPETTVDKTQENPVPVATETVATVSESPSVEIQENTTSKPLPSSTASNSSNQKPSFVQVIARLLANIIYGNKS